MSLPMLRPRRTATAEQVSQYEDEITLHERGAALR